MLSVLLMLATLQAPEGIYRTAVTTEAPPPANEARPNEEKLEEQLEAARRKLDEAARQVAELSAQLSIPYVQKFSTFNGGVFGRAIIGVQLDPASGKDGARVLSVSPGGPAAEAGMRAGDVIVAVNGTAVTGEGASRQVVKILRDVKPDDKLNVRALRDGKARDFTITARPGPGVMAFEGGAAFPPQLSDLPDMPHFNSMFMVQGPLSNMELATLTPQLGKYFGTDKGVLVVRAPDGALKLEDGDVILAIDGREPTSGSHATRILGSYQPGEKLTLRIVRQHKTVDLETVVPAEPSGPHKSIILRGGGPVTAPVPGKVVIMNRDDDAI